MVVSGVRTCPLWEGKMGASRKMKLELSVLRSNQVLAWHVRVFSIEEISTKMGG